MRLPCKATPKCAMESAGSTNGIQQDVMPPTNYQAITELSILIKRFIDTSMIIDEDPAVDLHDHHAVFIQGIWFGRSKDNQSTFL